MPVGPQLDPHRPGRAACSPCGACRSSVGRPSCQACSLLTVWCLSALSWTPIAPGVQPAHRVVPVGPQLDPHRPGSADCSPCDACRSSVGRPSPRACSLLTVWCLSALSSTPSPRAYSLLTVWCLSVLSWTPIVPGVQCSSR